MGTLWQDIRFGVRMVRQSPGFTVIAVLTLALGIGVNAAVFSTVNTVLLRPLAFPDADRLVWFDGVNPAKGITESNLSAPDFADWRDQNQVFESMGAFVSGGMILSGEGEPERVPGAAVTAGFFPTLGVAPILGRVPLPEEDRPGGEPVTVISHGLWQRRFGAAPDVVGRKIIISGRAATIVGVMPPGFDFPQRMDLWGPLGLNLSEERRDNRYLGVVARRKPGVTLEQAQANMNTLTERLAQTYVETNRGWGVSLNDLHEKIVGDVKPALVLLLGAVGFVLLIACANVANLLLARAASRRKEIAVRTALGASRLRIIRQLLTESVLLSVIGGTLGLLLSVWLIDILLAMSPANAPRFDEISLDGRVLGFTAALCCFTGLLFGLAPALQASKPDLNETLKEGGRGFSEGYHRDRVRKLLVISEVALSLVLLVGAGLLIKSFLLLRNVNPGFDPENVLTMRVSLPGGRYRQGQERANFFRALNERVRALPGVESASAVLSLPLGGSNFSVGRSFIREGRPLTVEESANAGYAVTLPGYFGTMRIPLRAGRDFTDGDVKDAPQVVVINETMARQHFAGEDPIGQRIRVWRDEEFPREIVGVAADVKNSTLDAEPGPQIYVPHAQDSGWGGLTLVLRTRVEPATLADSVRREVLALDKEQPTHDTKTMETVAAASVATRRVSMLAFSGFAGLALLLAGIGIYGVISYSVMQRTREIGIRMALGAQGRSVLRLVAGQSMKLALVGVAVGLVSAFALTRVMSSLLYGVSATDPVTFAGVTLVLLFVALLASYIPARRATRVDPMKALRYE